MELQRHAKSWIVVKADLMENPTVARNRALKVRRTKQRFTLILASGNAALKYIVLYNAASVWLEDAVPARNLITSRPA